VNAYPHLWITVDSTGGWREIGASLGERKSHFDSNREELSYFSITSRMKINLFQNMSDMIRVIYECTWWKYGGCRGVGKELWQHRKFCKRVLSVVSGAEIWEGVKRSWGREV
jgi:hypothetical protein